MNIWVIRDLEPIPTDPGGRRLMRAGMLSLALAARGHATTWFTSTFDHYQKRQRAAADATIPAAPNLTVEMFRAPGYVRNISIGRIRHNRAFAARWRDYAARARRPDVLVTDIPTTETAAAVAAFGAEQNIPVVLSIRDLWPDFFTDYLPPMLRPLARPFIWPLERQARLAAGKASSIVGISEDYLHWGLKKAGRSRLPADRVFPLGYAALPRPDAAALAAYRERLTIAPEAQIVSFVGSWGSTYDLDLLLATARELSSRPEIVLVVAGNTESRPHLATALRAQPNVRVADWLSATDIAALVSLSAMGILPYKAAAPQGLPNKVFEYMAYGAYQVAVLGGEIEQFYAETKTGRTSAGNAPALAAAIVESLPMGQDRAGRIALFTERYSAAVVYAQMAAHIEAMAGRQDGARRASTL